jgi:hypothetical protein
VPAVGAFRRVNWRLEPLRKRHDAHYQIACDDCRRDVRHAKHHQRPSRLQQAAAAQGAVKYGSSVRADGRRTRCGPSCTSGETNLGVSQDLTRASPLFHANEVWASSMAYATLAGDNPALRECRTDFLPADNTHCIRHSGPYSQQPKPHRDRPSH